MQGHRTSRLTVFLVLLTLAGCNYQTAPTPTPEDPAGPIRPGNDIPKEIVLVKSTGTAAETHQVIRPGTVVIWKHSSAFEIHFVADSPCKETSVANYLNYYASSQKQATSTTPSVYTVQCTVVPNPPQSHSFAYQIVAHLPRRPPASPVPPAPPAQPRAQNLEARTTPCGGCNYLDTDPE